MSKYLQKPTAWILIILTIFSVGGGLLLPKKAWAVVPVTDIAHTAETAAGWVEQFVQWAKEFAWKVAENAKKVAMAYLRKALLDMLVQEIVEWIQGGGSPKFVTDWKGFLRDAANQASGAVIDELGLTALCDPIWGPRIKIGLLTVPSFGDKYRCTFDDIAVNFANFQDNFFDGGWIAFRNTAYPNNNPYSVYLGTLDEILERQAEETQAKTNEALSGSGFLNDQVCKEITCHDEIGQPYTLTGTWKPQEMPSGCRCDQWITRTPGEILAQGLTKSAFADVDWIINSEEWQSYVVAILAAVMNRIIGEGVMALDFDGSNQVVGGRTSLNPNYTPGDVPDDLYPDGDSDYPGGGSGQFLWKPISESDGKLAILLPYECLSSCTVTADGVAGNYTKRTNGNRPTYRFSKPGCEFGENIKVIANCSGNESTWTIPNGCNRFEGSGGCGSSGNETVNITIKRAKDFLSRAVFIPDEPVTIYYTSASPPSTPPDPDMNSTKYMRAFHAGDWAFIKWFAVNQDGEREPTQTEFFLSGIPEVELTLPTVVVTSSIVYYDNKKFVELNPTNSKDLDDTDQIAMYEWDFKHHGTEFQWWAADYDRNGEFEEIQCINGYSYCSTRVAETHPAYIAPFVNGNTNFVEIDKQRAGDAPGVVRVKYQERTLNRIKLRVTDNEGLYVVKRYTIDTINGDIREIEDD
ncbi:hypothetical protein ACFL1O_00205 [Patescibacteria group bacterium]